MLFLCSVLGSISEYRGTLVAATETARRVTDMASKYGSPLTKPRDVRRRDDGGDDDHKRRRLEELPGFDSTIRTGKKTSDGKSICKPFNDNREGRGCAFGKKCNSAHVCDVLVGTGKNQRVCGSTNHNRLGHRKAEPPAAPGGEDEE